MLAAPWESTDPRDLDTALDQYARGAGRVNPSRARRWAAYAAASGSALTLAENAQAAVVYSGPRNISVNVANSITSNGDQALIDLLTSMTRSSRPSTTSHSWTRRRS
jgi:hypothetical protein